MNEPSMMTLVACVLALLGAPAAAADAGKATPEMPADHPPMFEAPKTAPRLAPDVVMARFGKETITAGDVDAAINAMGAPDRFEYNAPEPIRDLLEGMVDRRLMAGAARAAGLDKDPALREQLAAAGKASVAVTEAVLAEAWLARQLGNVPTPDDAAITRYYREHAAAFTVPQRVRVTRAVARTEATAARLRGELSNGASAEDLRARYSRDLVSAESLWVQDAPKKPQLTATALALKQREVSPVVPVDAGFAVMRADEKEAAKLRSLDEVRAGIAATLDAAAREEAVAQARKRLRADVRIAIVEEALLSYRAPPAGAAADPLR
jgi:hypothetical protein